MKVWQGGFGKPNSRFKTWFHQVLANRYHDKQHAKKEGLPTAFDEACFEPHVDALLSSQEQKNHLNLALQSFEPKERAAVILYYHQRVPKLEIANILGISIHNLEALLHRVRKQLAQQLSTFIVFSSKGYREQRLS